MVASRSDKKKSVTSPKVVTLRNIQHQRRRRRESEACSAGDANWILTSQADIIFAVLIVVHVVVLGTMREVHTLPKIRI